METLHLLLEKATEDRANLTYFSINPLDSNSSSSLSKITVSDLKRDISNNYYLGIDKNRPIDPERLGKKLYDWLDGEQYDLSSKIDGKRSITLAISATEELSHLPWELLHDGNEYLVQRNIIPIRWVKMSSRSTDKITVEKNPQKRALRLLFMATDPENSGLPPLNYEAEEAKILEANRRFRLFLQVEESGCLDILKELLVYYGEEDKDVFDVFHLTGHANNDGDKPYFVMENEIGERDDATVEDISEVFETNFPQLIFLSGCKSGQAGNEGVITSLAESLIIKGAKTVLGWGHKVGDQEGTIAASTFYQELNNGFTIVDSLGKTYRELLNKEVNGWHLLRLYIGNTLPSKLVTSPRNRPPAPPLSQATRIWGENKNKTVADRFSFVGRRRHIQHCIKALTPSAESAESAESVGVVIHGFGGYGKSSLAARLCDRLTDHIPIVWDLSKIPLNEQKFVEKFSTEIEKKYPSSDFVKILRQENNSLVSRLTNLFSILAENPIKDRYPNFLFIFDDFEQVLELVNQEVEFKRDNRPEVVDILTSLIEAIQEQYYEHRIIITSRYDLPYFPNSEYLHREELNEFRDADLEKKKNRLNLFKSVSKAKVKIQTRAEKIADGNARILEELDKILGENGLNHEQILQKLENLEKEGTKDYEDLQSQVITEELLKQVEKELKDVLSRGLIFEIPVPREALKEVCQGINNLDEHIDRAIRLGLISVTPTDKLLYVVRTFLPIDITENLTQNLATEGANKLYQLWWKEEDWKEEQAEEILRLAIIAQLKEMSLEVGDKLTKKWNDNQEFEKSIEFCEQILAHWKNFKAVKIYHNLAISYNLIGGKFEKAYQMFMIAYNMPVLCKLDSKQARVDLLYDYAGFLGDSYHANLRKVSNFLNHSLSIANEINDDLRRAKCKLLLGRFMKYNTNQHNYKDKLKNAENLLTEALKIFQRMNDSVGKASCLHELGMTQNSYGYYEKDSHISYQHYRKAIDIHNQAILTFKANKLFALVGYSWVQLGKNYVKLGEIEIPRQYFQKARDIIEKYGVMYAPSCQQWAKLEENQGNIFKAFELVLEALDINQKFQRADQKYNWILINRLFKAWKEKNFYNQEEGWEKSTKQLMEKLLELCDEDIDDRRHEKAKALWGLGKIAKQEGNREEALDNLNQAYNILIEIASDDAEEIKQCIDELTDNQKTTSS